MHVTRSQVRVVMIVLLAACALLALLITTGLVTSPFSKARVRQAKIWLLGNTPISLDDEDSCDCVWRIGCPKYRWQTNFTSPIYRCGFEPMTEGLVAECLAERRIARGRELKVHVAGHVREAFLVDYMRQRLFTTTRQQTCQFTKTPVGPKNFDLDSVDYYKVTFPADTESCVASHSRPGMSLDFKYIGILGPDAFSYVDQLTAECESEGCEGDILIFSGGVGELLNATLLDSFTGVRKFQKQYKRLLPMLIDLVTTHRMEVVWKIHEPVTDELIPENSMVRNDLLQEYNALIMEQTMTTPVQVWTSHMIMKLHHIEACALQAKSTRLNEDQWRCEEELVPGDNCHGEYFDAIFNKACDKHINMPENPCCSA